MTFESEDLGLLLALLVVFALGIALIWKGRTKVEVILPRDGDDVITTVELRKK